MFKTRKQDAVGNMFTGVVFPLDQVSWVLPTKGHVKFDEAKALMQFEGDALEEDVPILISSKRVF